jgi:hypothetical protein
LLNLLLEGSRNYNDRKQKEKPLTQIPLQNPACQAFAMICQPHGGPD